jgi:hypothetical protein
MEGISLAVDIMLERVTHQMMKKPTSCRPSTIIAAAPTPTVCFLFRDDLSSS